MHLLWDEVSFSVGAHSSRASGRSSILALCLFNSAARNLRDVLERTKQTILKNKMKHASTQCGFGQGKICNVIKKNDVLYSGVDNEAIPGGFRGKH